MRVQDVLRSKGDAVVTVTPDIDVRTLLDRLAEHRIGAVVVSADGSSVDGIVSERDIVRALAERGEAVLSEQVAAICTTDVQTCEPSTALEELMSSMTQGRFRHVPVVIDGALHGIVSIGDVVKFRLGELESERDSLSAYISSAG